MRESPLVSVFFLSSCPACTSASHACLPLSEIFATIKAGTTRESFGEQKDRNPCAVSVCFPVSERNSYVLRRPQFPEENKPGNSKTGQITAPRCSPLCFLAFKWFLSLPAILPFCRLRANCFCTEKTDFPTTLPALRSFTLGRSFVLRFLLPRRASTSVR